MGVGVKGMDVVLLCEMIAGYKREREKEGESKREKLGIRVRKV